MGEPLTLPFVSDLILGRAEAQHEGQIVLLL